MCLCLKSSLLKLARLSVERLHETALRIRKALAGAEWKMGVCLLAMSRGKRYLERGFSSVLEYAEKSLKLSRKKAYLLHATARALEHLPLASAAYQAAEICWSKMRTLQSVLTPETEAEWLKFAFDRSAHEVSQAVAMSPTAWKGQRALEASKAAAPIASSEAVQDIVARQVALDGNGPAPANALAAGIPPANALSYVSAALDPSAITSPTPTCSAVTASASAVGTLAEVPKLVPRGDQMLESQDLDAGSDFVMPGLIDSAPKKIRLTIELTPDQYAVFEVAQRHARAQMGRRANIAQVLVHMSERLLDSGTARTRAKHQIIIHTTPEREYGWYRTDKGLLPVSPEILSQARPASVQPNSAPKATGPTTDLTNDPKPEPGTARTSNSKPDAATARSSAKRAEPERRLTNDPMPEPPTALTDDPMPWRSSAKRAEPEKRTEKKPSGSRRTDVPIATVRAVFHRAGHCCQRCGEGTMPLQIHHKRPVSEGGTNDVEALELLCPTCHAGHHERDYLAKPHWTAARDRAVGKTGAD